MNMLKRWWHLLTGGCDCGGHFVEKEMSGIASLRIRLECDKCGKSKYITSGS